MGLGSSIGKLVNGITGATDAAQTNWKYQKQAMQNAHQWEVQDLTKAGLNPVYSANSQGASTGGASPGMQAGGTGLLNSAMTAMTEGAKLLQGQKKIDAETQNLNADTAGKEIENTWKDPINQSLVDQRNAIASANNAEASLRDKRAELINSQVMNNMAETNLSKIRGIVGESEYRNIREQIKRQRMENKQLEKQYGLEGLQIDREQKYLQSGIGSTLNYIGKGWNDIKGPVQSAAGIAGMIAGSKKLDKVLQSKKPYDYDEYNLAPNGGMSKKTRFYRDKN